MEDRNEDKRTKAAASAVAAGFAMGGPAGLVIGLAGAGVIIGGGYLIDRFVSNNNHAELINRYRMNEYRMNADINRVRGLKDQLDAQNDVQMATIESYRGICDRLRQEYDFEKNQYPELLSEIEELEAMLNAKVNGDASCVVM